MSISANLPSSALETALSFLLPLIRPTLSNDIPAAQALALHMLGEYEPQTVRELHLAAEAIGFSLKSLTVLAQSAEPDITPEKLDVALKWACSLSRSSHQAQRRLTELQRAARSAPPAESVRPAPGEPIATAPTTSASLTLTPTQQPEPNTTLPDVPAAEAALASATKLLNLMKAHHKGAPPPHTQAAQQIQAQQRVVETARLKLEQARRRQATTDAPRDEPTRAAA